MRTLLALLFCTACAGNHVAPPPRTAAETRTNVLERRLAWISDSIPILQFATPYIYGAWRLEVERCSGKTKDGWPAFYVAPVAPLGPDGRSAFYASDSKVIVFGLGSEAIDWIVRHELAHWLLDPIGGHPEEYFGPTGKCGRLVNPPQS